MEPVIREFNMKDYEEVINLWHKVSLPIRSKGRESRTEIHKQINNGITIFLVGEVNGTIVAAVLGTHDGRKGWINRLAVDPDFRRQHMAKRMVSKLEEKFQQMGLEVTVCLIEEENKTSMELFKSLGYQEWSGKYFSKRKSPES